MENNNYSFKEDLPLIDRGGAITNLLEIKNDNLYYFQDKIIKSVYIGLNNYS